MLCGRKLTYRNKALSSPNPSASARTASFPPSFLNANMARYLSNRVNFVSIRVARRVGMGIVLDKLKRGEDEGGAGSMVGKALCAVKDGYKISTRIYALRFTLDGSPHLGFFASSIPASLLSHSILATAISAVSLIA